MTALLPLASVWSVAESRTMSETGIFTFAPSERHDEGAPAWNVLDGQGEVIASIAPTIASEDWAKKIAHALNAFRTADAALMDAAAALIDAAHTPGTSVSRDLRTAARELCGGAPYAYCVNDGDDCVWTGHAPAPHDAETLQCPHCGEPAQIVR